MGNMVTYGENHILKETLMTVFSETFQSEIYSMFKQISGADPGVVRVVRSNPALKSRNANILAILFLVKKDLLITITIR